MTMDGVILRGVLLLVGLSLCGCFSVVTKQAGVADAIAGRGDLQAAESAYASAMTEILAEEEWDYIFVRRCEVRTEIARERLKEAQNGTPSLQEVLGLESYIRRCPSFVELEAPVSDVKIRVVDGLMRENVDPLFEEGKHYEALKAAHEYTPHLMAEHPRNAYLDQFRTSFAEGLRSQGESLKSYPTLSAAHLWIGSFAGLYEAPAPTQATEDFLKVWLRSTVPVEVGEGCASYPIPTDTPAGTPFEIVSVKVSDCRKGVSIEEDDEEYTAFETKYELREVSKTVVTPVTTTTVTHHKVCSGSSPCRTTHTTSSSSTVNRYSSYTEWEQIPVRVPVQRIRKARYGNATRSANLVMTIRSEDGEEEVSHRITLSNRSQPFPLKERDEVVKAFDTREVLIPGFIERMSSTTVDVARKQAVKMRAGTLVGLYEASKEAEDPNLTLDRALMVWYSGTRSEEVAAEINAAFPIALTTFGTSKDYVIASYKWDPGVVVSDYFEYDPPGDIMASVVVAGYPFLSFGFNGTLRTPETFLGQPDRSSLQVDYSNRVRFTLSSGSRHKGVGLLVGYDLNLSMGTRLGDDYERIEELPIFVVEEDNKELKITFGLEGAAVFGAGWRSKHLGIFAGVKPTYTSFKIGHFFSEGGTVPILGRLELRVRERYPVILEGTWGDLTESDELAEPTRFGASLDWPLSEGLWLRAVANHQVLPAEFFGIYEQDDVYVERARVQTYSLGLSFTIW